MQKVRVIAQISDEHYREYEEEAKRRGVPVERLIQRTIDVLVREFETKQTHDPDRPIFVC